MVSGEVILEVILDVPKHGAHYLRHSKTCGKTWLKFSGHHLWGRPRNGLVDTTAHRLVDTTAAITRHHPRDYWTPPRAVPHSTPPHPTPLHSTPVHLTPLHCTPLHSTPPHSTPLHSIQSTPHHSTPLHPTPPHSTPLHSTPLHTTQLCMDLACLPAARTAS
jgi:hypothetical protein